jgi:hypothetical protein
MPKPKGMVGLFDAKSVFTKITGQRYTAMCSRLRKKNLPPLSFQCSDFRAHVLEAMGNSYDGVLQCRYCNHYFTISEVAVDHAIPLSRGGSTDLHNLEYPCRACNNRKGSLTPTEFLALLGFLETIPLGRQDVLKRLETSVQLAAGARGNAGIIADLRKAGVWSAAQKARRKKNG